MREYFKEGLASSAALLFPCWQEAENIIQKIRQQQYPELLAFDQLLIERKDHKVFLQFGKAPVQQQIPLPFPAPSSLSWIQCGAYRAVSALPRGGSQ